MKHILAIACFTLLTISCNKKTTEEHQHSSESEAPTISKDSISKDTISTEQEKTDAAHGHTH
ncbi:hypothetical protein IRZ71_21610 [Flavobacterium sp. ANB]|uniref:hypothetical protein n=1 Tax=unclassified Flavobacterium TaxID=196869 RepID=UPI0012B71270|nr:MULTISPECIES: hypothetical protein [unclassified Flavobacterium]MBF4518962.1 hypothetical protein [Flavobacterium sp. ANB]MTD71572.1 hypothetical protein [Flavobacterium sp. LC2016-13]